VPAKEAVRTPAEGPPTDQRGKNGRLSVRELSKNPITICRREKKKIKERGKKNVTKKERTLDKGAKGED